MGGLIACVVVVSIFLLAKWGKHERRARALGKKEHKSRSGGEGQGRKGNACR